MPRTKAPANGKAKTPTNRISKALAETSSNGNGEEHPPKGVKETTLTIPEPNFEIVRCRIVGSAQLVQNKFSAKARDQIRATQEAGSTGKKGMKRSPKDFEAAFQDAQHRSVEGWHGIPCAAFRNSMIDACRLVGFAMTRCKQAIFVLPDGEDRDEGTGLVRIIGDAPKSQIVPVRNASGVIDLRNLPCWKKWAADVTIRYDADILTRSDVVNLLMRAGIQCGVQEGRPNGKNGNGMGQGTWDVDPKGIHAI